MNHTIRAALLVVAFLFVVSACHAQTEFPKTPAANQAKAWLEAFNAGDAEKYKEFRAQQFSDASTACGHGCGVSRDDGRL